MTEYASSRLDDLPTIDEYRLGTAHSVHGVALLVMPKSTTAFALPLDLNQIEEFRRHLADAEMLLKSKSGTA